VPAAALQGSLSYEPPLHKYPAGQVVPTADSDPAGQYLPALVLQGEQDAAPAEDVNFPTAHAEQTELSAIEILPAVHGVQIVAPVVFENVPGEQIVQVEALGKGEYLPGTQSVHVDDLADAGLCFPASH